MSDRESQMRNGEKAETGAAGFSLLELIVAMAITLVITGAIYGLIAGGQTAFRREPEMAERQQNIRMAMDIIMKDISNAASGLPTFVQAFATGLDAIGPPGPDAANTDEIEILTNSESRDTEPTCRGAANDADVRLMRDLTVGANPLRANTIVIPFTATGRWTVRNVVAATPNGALVAGTPCSAGAQTAVNLLAAGDPTGLNTAGAACEPNAWGNTISPCELVGLSFANLVRYRIRLDAANVPMLERWSSDAPGAFVGGVRQGFQTLARGIENLQVQYLRADGNPNTPADWLDSAPLVVLDDYRSLVTQVRVRIAARSEAQNIAGARTSAAGGTAIRGSLVSSASPRATLNNITLAPQPAPPAAPVPLLWR
jgi:prepilin-type N-terminal cleavage/methylation domain-containing protein